MFKSQECYERDRKQWCVLLGSVGDDDEAVLCTVTVRMLQAVRQCVH